MVHLQRLGKSLLDLTIHLRGTLFTVHVPHMVSMWPWQNLEVQRENPSKTLWLILL